MSDVGLDTVVADEYERKLSLLRFRSDFESRSPVSKSTVQRYLDQTLLRFRVSGRSKAADPSAVSGCR